MFLTIVMCASFTQQITRDATTNHQGRTPLNGTHLHLHNITCLIPTKIVVVDSLRIESV